MKIRINQNYSINLQRPVRFEGPQIEQLLFKFKDKTKLCNKKLSCEFLLRTYRDEDENNLLKLFVKCGLVSSKKELDQIFKTCIPEGCFVIEKDGLIVSSMMARHVNTFSKFSGRIDWLATDPKFNGLGLGRKCASSATKRLEQAGYDDIWVTTDDHRLAAIKIFLDIGFEPYLPDKSAERWRNILKLLGRNSTNEL